jgi:hypothetical protein
VPSQYGSSTNYVPNDTNAWVVYFYNGLVDYYLKSNVFYVRAVRGGPCRSEGDWCLDESDCDDDLFCTGTESCVDSMCEPGAGDPCTGDNATPFCDEDNETCAECLADGDCPDDGQYCTGVPACDDGWCGFTGNPCGDGTPVCDEDNNTCVQCLTDGDCGETEWCRANVCVPRCNLIVTNKPILSSKLTRTRKFVLKVTSLDETFDIFGLIDLGPLSWESVKFNRKKNRLKITAIVPAGLGPQVIPISVGDCFGEVVIQ